MALLNSRPYLQKIRFFSIIPKGFLHKLFLKRVQSIAPTFVKEEDKIRLYFISNTSIALFVLLLIIQSFIFNFNDLINILLSFIASLAFLFVNGAHTASRIIKRREDLEEQAFLFINSLAINMTTTQSFPHAIELMKKSEIQDQYFQQLQHDILFGLNLGESEEKILERGQYFFQNKRYQYAFLNIKRKETFIDSDPEFLNNIKKMIALLEDNISIFIALSSLFPLVLSLVLSIILPVDSPLIFLFPLFYSLLGSFILRFIQIQSLGEISGKIKMF
ncbi:MAG: hypothetical protein ACTSQE_02310 [Candidatus Heimdallarchaeaceae archaeon]